MKVSIGYIKPGMKVSKNIFTPQGKLLLSEGTILNIRHIRKLFLYKIEYINVVDPYDCEGVPDPSRADILYEESFSAIKNVMNNVRNEKSVDISLVADVVEEIVAQVVEDPNAFKQLSSIRDLDNYTFLHSIDVCIYSVILGRILGLDTHDLRRLGTGSILHDVGKCKVPAEILLKPASLTPEEYNIMKLHTRLGYEILRDSSGIDYLTASMALQHHEHWNGRGYPSGLKEGQISLFSRIVSIADIYDALTADRIYRERVLPHVAAEYILVNSGTQLDPFLVDIFLHKVAFYPEGSTVLLSTGEIGKVIRINPSVPLRPMIQVYSHISKENINPYLLDLENILTVFIEDVIS